MLTLMTFNCWKKSKLTTFSKDCIYRHICTCMWIFQNYFFSQNYFFWSINTNVGVMGQVPELGGDNFQLIVLKITTSKRRRKGDNCKPLPPTPTACESSNKQPTTVNTKHRPNTLILTKSSFVHLTHPVQCIGIFYLIYSEVEK